MKLSVLIPAHNEEGCIQTTLEALYKCLKENKIEHEMLIVNDNSQDKTEEILIHLKKSIPSLSYINNSPPNGFGFAIRCGLEKFTGDIVAIYMADASDRPEDLVKYYREMLRKNVDCVFGSRFKKKSKIIDYPWFKLILNRIFNLFIMLIFRLKYNDTTNAFKMYRRHVINGLQPLLSHHFNLTIELPLKAIIRGYTYSVVANDWINRKKGESKLHLKEMGSRYFFIALYCFIEKWLSKGDYFRKDRPYNPLIKESNKL